MNDKVHVFTKGILRLLEEGKSILEISRTLGCTPAAVRYHKIRIGRVPKLPRYDWVEIQRLHKAGASRLELMAKFGFSEPAWVSARKRGDITPKNQFIPIESFFQVGVKFDRGNMRRRLLRAGILKNECNQCGASTWMGVPLNCQIHHRNGDNMDNRRDNLEMLCPNCHSITETYGSQNSTRVIVKRKKLGLPHPQMSRLDSIPPDKLKAMMDRYEKPKRPALGIKAPLSPLRTRVPSNK